MLDALAAARALALVYVGGVLAGPAVDVVVVPAAEGVDLVGAAARVHAVVARVGAQLVAARASREEVVAGAA